MCPPLDGRNCLPSTAQRCGVVCSSLGQSHYLAVIRLPAPHADGLWYHAGPQVSELKKRLDELKLGHTHILDKKELVDCIISAAKSEMNSDEAKIPSQRDKAASFSASLSPHHPGTARPETPPLPENLSPMQRTNTDHAPSGAPSPRAASQSSTSSDSNHTDVQNGSTPNIVTGDDATERNVASVYQASTAAASAKGLGNTESTDAKAASQEPASFCSVDTCVHCSLFTSLPCVLAPPPPLQVLKPFIITGSAHVPLLTICLSMSGVTWALTEGPHNGREGKIAARS